MIQLRVGLESTEFLLNQMISSTNFGWKDMVKLLSLGNIATEKGGGFRFMKLKNIHYPIELIPIPEHEGGGWMARIPAFGDAFVGDGEDPFEALKNLEMCLEMNDKEVFSSSSETDSSNEEI